MAYSQADAWVFDRGHISEVVYGDIWRGGQHFAPWQRRFLDEYVLTEFVVVLAYAPGDLLRARHAAKADQRIQITEIEVVQRGFMEAMTDHRVVRYDSSSMDSLDVAVNTVLERLRVSTNHGSSTFS